MKKIILIMALLLIAAPAMATVTITCSGDDEGVVTVSYTATGNDVRAFALDVNAVDANITSITRLDPNYFVHPGSTRLKDPNATIQNAGQINCASSFAGTLPGLGTSGVTTEQASLYIGAADSPGGAGTGSSGDLFSFVVDANCTVQIRENAIRGGVVMENPDEDPALVNAGGVLTSCAVVLAVPCLMDVTGDLDGVELDTNWLPIYTGNFDAPNGVINLTDFGAMANLLVNEGGTAYSVPVYPAIAAFDVTGDLDGVELDTNWLPVYTGNFDAPNGAVNLTDFGAMANRLLNEGGTAYSVPCD